MSKIAWKAYEEVHFSDQYILRWVREGDEYANRITKEMMEDLKSVVRQQQAEIEAVKESNKNLMELVTMLREEVNSLRQLQAENEALKKQLYFKDYYEELPETPVDVLSNFKPIWREKPTELTNEEIADFTHRMVLCCQVHPNSADINVLGLAQIVEEIRNK